MAYQAGDEFKFGGFGAAVQNKDPVLFDLPVQIVDADGDIVAASSTIDVSEPGSYPPRARPQWRRRALPIPRLEWPTTMVTARVSTAWVGPQDGILVHDANQNGNVDRASEFVFGGAGIPTFRGSPRTTATRMGS